MQKEFYRFAGFFLEIRGDHKMSGCLSENNCIEKSNLSLMDILLQRESSQEAVLQYCFDRFRALFEYDEKNGTEYLRTLQVYLETGNSLSASAKKLFVHRNTVLQRMKKIASLLQTDFHDFSTASEYYFMIRIIQYSEDAEGKDV